MEEAVGTDQTVILKARPSQRPSDAGLGREPTGSVRGAGESGTAAAAAAALGMEHVAERAQGGAGLPYPCRQELLLRAAGLDWPVGGGSPLGAHDRGLRAARQIRPKRGPAGNTDVQFRCRCWIRIQSHAVEGIHHLLSRLLGATEPSRTSRSRHSPSSSIAPPSNKPSGSTQPTGRPHAIPGSVRQPEPAPATPATRLGGLLARHPPSRPASGWRR